MTIQIHQLQKRFGEKTAVNIPQFTIGEGEVWGLVGNNGAGKTTLFRLMLDLLQADSGTVTYRIAPSPESVVSEMNPATCEEWKQYTGAYIDETFLIDFLTPEEYFNFLAKVCHISQDTMQERLSAFSAFMNGEIIGQKKLIRDLSSGNKQKVGIIAALLNQPQTVILDEPFNFLDPSSQHALKRLIKEYNQRTEATILISSHNLQHTVEISTRVALMEHGEIIKDLPNSNGEAEQELEYYFSGEEVK